MVDLWIQDTNLIANRYVDKFYFPFVFGWYVTPVDM